MTQQQIIIATIIWFISIAITYSHSGFNNIKNCYKMWFTREYWTNYNIVEFASWLAKAIIIVPGLIFNIQIWWLYFFTLATSLTLIWASNKKLLPTLVGFNTIWVWISCMVLAQNLI
jgi:hypothetical protein